MGLSQMVQGFIIPIEGRIIRYPSFSCLDFKFISHIICSQPPFLSSMVLDIYKRTKDIEFLKRALPSLLKEHEFWNSGPLSNQGNVFLFCQFL